MAMAKKMIINGMQLNTINVISCMPGWEKLYKPIMDAIYKHDDEQTNIFKKIGVSSIRAEDGQLIFNVTHPQNLTKEIKDLIDKNERESLNVCEICGATDNVGTTMNFEYDTCCKDCWEKYILPNNQNSIWKSFKTNQTFRVKNA